MQQKPETTAIEIRPLANEAERAAYFRLNAQIFRSQEEIEIVAATRQRFITGMPTFDPAQLRGAFLSGQLVGGYVHLKRFLNIEETQILTGCISGVCTEASFRKRGIAAALMIDALDFAQKQEQHLLMLHGIPDFYHRFKYIDVCEDLPEYSFKHELIATLPATSYQVRPLTREDTPAILKLYLEQQGLSPVSFAGSRTPT
ncbi:MAG TPA: GNAT family N-acetyltransferase, partial [Ktedonobacteraceae bacterium]|nr:GNAT family N-acetyltransferase [Ktedonobacteraceae bacterium]